nr:MAG TPA: hypothetical protein [Bacteriophage sp.]
MYLRPLRTNKVAKYIIEAIIKLMIRDQYFIKL